MYDDITNKDLLKTWALYVDALYAGILEGLRLADAASTVRLITFIEFDIQPQSAFRQLKASFSTK